MKRVFTLFLAVVLVVVMTVPASAAEAVGKVQAFEDQLTTGDEQYINKKDYYYLDMKESSLSDKLNDPLPPMINAIANGIFGLELRLVDLTCTLLYYVSIIDLQAMVGMKINGVQQNLYDNLFTPSFNLAFLFVGLFLAWLLLKRNYGEILNQLGKVFLVCFMAAMLASNTTWFIGMDNAITNAISGQVAAAMSSNSGAYSNADFAVTASGQIWKTQVHIPWRMLEFLDYNPANEQDLVDRLLDLPKKSEERKAEIKSLNDNNQKAFSFDVPGERLLFSVIYLIPLLIKCLIIIAICLLQLAFKVVKVFYYFLGIPVMLLSLIPQLGGTKIIGCWFQKIFEMSFMIVILNFALSIILWFDEVLWAYAPLVGWLTVIILQVGIAVVVFLFRNKILGILESVQNVVSNPAIAARQIRRTMRDSGNVSGWAQSADKHITGAAVYASGQISDGIKSTGAYKQVASSANTIMHTWRDGLREDIGSILPDGNVFQSQPITTPAIISNQTTSGQTSTGAEPVNGNKKATNTRPNVDDFYFITAAEALKHEGLAATPENITDEKEKTRPLLFMLENENYNPDVAQSQPKLADMPLSNTPVKNEKSQPPATAQKQTWRQTSPEPARATAPVEIKKQTMSPAAGTISDLGMGQRTMRDTSKIETKKNRPVLEKNLEVTKAKQGA